MMSTLSLILALAIVAAAHPPLLYTNYVSGTPNQTVASNSTWTFSSKSSTVDSRSLRTEQVTLPGSLSKASSTSLSQTTSSSRLSTIPGASTLTAIASLSSHLSTKYPISGYSNSTNLNSTWIKSYNTTTFQKFANSSQNFTKTSLAPVQTGQSTGTALNSTSLPENGTWAYSLKNASSISPKVSEPLFRVAATRVKPKMVFAHFMVRNLI